MRIDAIVLFATVISATILKGRSTGFEMGIRTDDADAGIHEGVSFPALIQIPSSLMWISTVSRNAKKKVQRMECVILRPGQSTPTKRRTFGLGGATARTLYVTQYFPRC